MESHNWRYVSKEVLSTNHLEKQLDPLCLISHLEIIVWPPVKYAQQINCSITTVQNIDPFSTPYVMYYNCASLCSCCGLMAQSTLIT